MRRVFVVAGELDNDFGNLTSLQLTVEKISLDEIEMLRFSTQPIGSDRISEKQSIKHSDNKFNKIIFN